MPIPNSFLDSAIYIYPSEEAARNGSGVGASGFVVCTEDEAGNTKDYYAVTNAHVIEGIARNAGQRVALRVNRHDGSAEVVATNIDEWTPHPSGDDVAICKVSPTHEWKFTHFSESTFLKPEYLHDQISLDTPPKAVIPISKTDDEEKWQEVHKIGVGDDVVVIGRYAQHPGRDRNIPAVRFGHISMVPIDPVEQADRNGFMQESILVECQSISGLSGSPVISQTRLDHLEKTPTSSSTRYDQMVLLVGVDWGHFDLKGEIAEIPSSTVRVPSGMMCVVPAWKISEILATA